MRDFEEYIEPGYWYIPVFKCMRCGTQYSISHEKVLHYLVKDMIEKIGFDTHICDGFAELYRVGLSQLVGWEKIKC